MIVSAFAEVVSLGAVLPFIGILVAPDRVFSHPIVADVTQAWGITSADQLVFPLTVVFIAVALVAGAIRILLVWASTRLAFSTGADLGIDVYSRTLYQPYQVHAATNSSEVISGITIKVNDVVFMVLLPLLTNGQGQHDKYIMSKHRRKQPSCCWGEQPYRNAMTPTPYAWGATPCLVWSSASGLASYGIASSPFSPS